LKKGDLGGFKNRQSEGIFGKRYKNILARYIWNATLDRKGIFCGEVPGGQRAVLKKSAGAPMGAPL
jgi:hypothetical protein